MTLLTFGAKSAEQVAAGKKTVTLRKWPKSRVSAGEVCDAARMGYPPTKFAKIKISSVARVKLGDIDDSLAKRDGVASAAEVKAYWKKQGFDAEKELWLIEFKLHRGA